MLMYVLSIAMLVSTLASTSVANNFIKNSRCNLRLKQL